MYILHDLVCDHLCGLDALVAQLRQDILELLNEVLLAAILGHCLLNIVDMSSEISMQIVECVQLDLVRHLGFSRPASIGTLEDLRVESLERVLVCGDEAIELLHVLLLLTRQRIVGQVLQDFSHQDKLPLCNLLGHEKMKLSFLQDLTLISVVTYRMWWRLNEAVHLRCHHRGTNHTEEIESTERSELSLAVESLTYLRVYMT